jgi:hypothetical protein
VDATNSRKKSPRSSRKSETQTTSVGNTPPPRNVASELDSDPYDERGIDLVARVRAAREAAQRKMDAFGDPADYVVRKIHPSPALVSVEDVVASPTTDQRQQSFPFEAAAPVANGFDLRGKE